MSTHLKIGIVNRDGKLKEFDTKYSIIVCGNESTQQRNEETYKIEWLMVNDAADVENVMSPPSFKCFFGPREVYD